MATGVFNLLNIPVGCLPVTRVDPAQDMVTDKWKNEPGHGSTLLEDGIFYGKTPLYNPKQCKGMPVNIQIAGRKWEEEKLLAMMQVVDDSLGKGRGFGPGAYDDYVKKAAAPAGGVME